MADVKEILKRPHARVVIPEEDGTFSAAIPDWPGCFGEGDTPAEAIENLERVAESWVLACIETNIPIPGIGPVSKLCQRSSSSSDVSPSACPET